MRMRADSATVPKAFLFFIFLFFIFPVGRKEGKGSWNK